MDRIDCAFFVFIGICILCLIGLIGFFILGNTQAEIEQKEVFCSTSSGIVFERTEFLGSTWTEDFHFMSDFEFKQYCEEK